MGIGVLSRSLRGRGFKLTTPTSKMNERNYTSAILIRTRGVHRGRLTFLYSQLVSDISILIYPYIHMTWSCVWKPVCKLLLLLVSPRCMYISTDFISFTLWTIDSFDIKTIKHKNSNHITQKFRNVLCTQLSVWRSRNTPPPPPKTYSLLSVLPGSVPTSIICVYSINPDGQCLLRGTSSLVKENSNFASRSPYTAELKILDYQKVIQDVIWRQ